MSKKYSGVTDIHSEGERIHDFGHEVVPLKKKIKGHTDGSDPGKQYETAYGEHLEGYGCNVDEGKQDALIGYECEHDHDHLDGHPPSHFSYLPDDEALECGYESLGEHNTSDDKAQTYDSDGGPMKEGEIGGKHEAYTYDEKDEI